MKCWPFPLDSIPLHGPRESVYAWQTFTGLIAKREKEAEYLARVDKGTLSRRRDLPRRANGDE